MTEILEIFKAYNGTGYYCILFLAALIYLWYSETNKTTRAIVVITPLLIQLIFFIPYFYKIYNKLDAGTYYRILWLLPMTLVIAYAGCRVIGNHVRMGLAIVCVILVISGTYVYKNINITPAENAYHLPQECIDLCDMVKPAEGKERVWVAFPPSLVHFVRQYTTEIQLPFGRDNMVSTWKSYENPLYDLYCGSVMPADKLSEYGTQYNCNYFILERKMRVYGNLEDYDILKIGETDNYIVYRNKSVPLWDKVAE
ncbi:MAG: hypothetical protein K5662_05690 [Lachnospiraceae bacterium]|nr:hypothetical protein [Lachnospiraceae bacterium]